MNKRHIVLLTDFGSGGFYPGLMKGVIAGINPSANIIDLCHDIESQNLRQGAFLLLKSFEFFPKNSVFISVIDPGVGSNRRAIACKIADYYFISPDNGLLSYVIAENDLEEAIVLDKPQYHLSRISNTFHGRDIFAPVAAHLTNGVELTEMGSKIAFGSIEHFETLHLEVKPEESVTGEVVFIDAFGNLITSVTAAALLEGFDDTALNFKIKDYSISGLSPTYSNVEVGSPVAYIGSFGTLELAVNCGNASEYFDVKAGEKVLIER